MKIMAFSCALFSLMFGACASSFSNENQGISGAEESLIKRDCDFESARESFRADPFEYLFGDVIKNRDVKSSLKKFFDQKSFCFRNTLENQDGYIGFSKKFIFRTDEGLDLKYTKTVCDIAEIVKNSITEGFVSPIYNNKTIRYDNRSVENRLKFCCSVISIIGMSIHDFKHLMEKGHILIESLYDIKSKALEYAK